MRDDQIGMDVDSMTFEQESLYWRKFVQDASGYVRFYRTGDGTPRTRTLTVDPAAISAFLSRRGVTRLELFGSVFAMYLSRIHRSGGCLLRTSIPGGESGDAGFRTMIRVDVNSRARFIDLTAVFRSALAEAAAHTKTDIDGYLREKATWYAIYDAPEGSDDAASRDDAVLALLSDSGSLSLRYQPDVFSETEIDRMAKNLEYTLAAVLEAPDQTIGEMEMLSPEEQALLTAFSRGKTVPVEKERLFSAGFRENAKSHPDVIAVDDGVRQVTYGELERSSNAVAHDLSEGHHLGRGSRVGLMLPRDYHFPELILAINKIGAAYIPLDPLLPAIRIGHMLRIAHADCLITTKELGESLPIDANVLYLEDLRYDHTDEVDIRTDGDDPILILFTSGTTGIPKGVLFRNGSFPWAGATLADIFHLSPGDVVGNFVSFSFVASLFLNATLYLGGTVRIFNEREQKDSLLLLKALKETHMNSLILPPAVGIPLYEREDLNLDYLILAGAKLNELSKKERHTRLMNFYGTTEVVFAVSKIYDVREIPEDRTPPVGKPVPNNRVYVLDAENHRMPVGAPGEICVASGYCAAEYCDDPELTAARFVPNPFSDSKINATLYRTGDIGFYNEDGEIEIIGREDSQLSVRGFRVESGEILSILKRFSGIKEVYLDVENDNLIAYYTASEDLKLDQVQDALRNELPYYMIPSLFIRLDRIPLSLNGKIDRERLKTTERRRHVEITDEILQGVVDAWKEVLGLDDVSVDDHFAALGGNSLSAMKLLLVLKEKLDVSLSASDLIDLSTPKEIAGYIKYHVRSAWDENKYDFDRPCPLSESQLNVYLDEGVHDRWDAYHNPFMIRFHDREQATPEKLRAALGGLFRAFPVLKARVLLREDAPFFVFDAEPEIAAGGAADIASFVRPFETEKSLSRYLIAEDGEDLALCMDFHHLIFDGSSLNVLLRALFALLEGKTLDFVDDGVPRETAFEEAVMPTVLEEGRAFFERMLADQEETSALPASVETTSDADTDRAREYLCDFEVDAGRLSAFLRRNNLTENQFFAGVFAYTLSRFTGSEKVLFNLAEDGRGHIDLSRSVGMFVKTLPVLMDCRDQAVSSFLRSASGLVNTVMKHDLVPFRMLARDYGVNAGVIFQYAHTIFDDALRQAGNCDIQELPHPQNADLAFTVFNRGREGLVLRALHSSLYDNAFIERFAASYRMILEGMLSAERLSDLRYTSDSDLAELDRYNHTEAPIRYQDILEAFNDRLREHPDSRLVECGDVCYSFAEGAYIADRIRRKLLESGVRPGDRVSFLVPRSEWYLFCTLGIMALGATYVPLDENLPDERVAFMIGDTASRVLIVTDGTLARARGLLEMNGQAPEDRDVTLLNLSDLPLEPAGRADRLSFDVGEIACILYTSGSTGVPKGVRITRKSLAYFIDFHIRDLSLQPGDIYGLYASIGFDVSMAAMFSVAASGACLDVIPHEIKFNIQALDGHFKKHHVTHSYITTQVARMFISQVEETSLRVLLTGGEKLGQVNETRHYRIVDAYGPTEACVYVISADTEKKIDASSVGFAQTNTKAYILDREFRRSPIGAVGGLYLSGPQLADGYLNREAETAAAFLTNPFETDPEYAGLYATGDVARILPDGTYGIIGRRDGQVKIRGNRVELTAVEAMIRQIEIVRDVTAQVRQVDGNNELIAYVVSDETDDSALRNTVTDFLSTRAPGYMVPSYVIRMDRIPLNVNGKVDKRALPAVDSALLHADYVAPETDLEQAVVQGFEQVFHRERIGVNDDFVRLGGDSLTAMKMLVALKEKLDVSLSASDLIGLSTPKKIAGYIQSHAHSAWNENKYDFDRPCPLSESQLNVYLDESVHDRRDMYRAPFIIRFHDRERATPEKLRAALQELFRAFPVLKARVLLREDAPFFVFDAEPEIAMGTSADIASFARPFETDKSLSRYLIAEDGEDLALCMEFHHLVFDGSSLNVLLRALFAMLDGKIPDFVDNGVLRETAFEEAVMPTVLEEGRAFFDRMLADQEETGALPASVETVPDADKDMAREYLCDFEVDDGRLNVFLRRNSLTENQFFAGVFAYTLSRFTGSEKVLFNLVEDGRGHIDLSHSVGMFVKTLPVLMDCRDQEVSSFLRSASGLINTVMKHDLVPFRLLAREYGLNAGTLFQYAHTMIDDALRQAGDCEIDELRHAQNADLSFFIFNHGRKGFIIRIFHSSLYDSAFIERFAESFRMILEGMLSAERLSDLRYTSDSDLALLDRYNHSEAPIRYQDILEAFNDRLREQPDSRLVECGDVFYSYAEGAYIADRIRQRLVESGVRPGDMVSFLVPRSELYLFCTMGIMARGAAYVPLDDTLPDERLAFMIGDTASRVLIVTDVTMARARELLAKSKRTPETPEVTLLNLSDLLREPAGRAERMPFAGNAIACILYTSGSTGVPKGVRITRKSLTNFIEFVVRDLAMGPGDICALFASIGFDVSMEAMFSVIWSGACLNVIPNEIKFNIQAMNRYFMKYHVTCAHFSAQVARMFISQVEETSLRVLLTGGEMLGQINDTRKYRIEDTYGPTEACVYVHCVDVDQKIDSSSIGFVIANTKAYILDRERRRTPIGAVGGLYLSGIQLADGYLNREAETAAAFLPNPFETDADYARLYATGDVARVLPDGSYGFMGRRDGQVKIRGNRVELSEVETLIRQMEIILDVTAQVKQMDGNNELIAYVVSDETDDRALRTAVTDFLSDRAPAYMVPSYVVRMDRIPLNVNGKVDKRALPAVDPALLYADYVAPETDMERAIVQGFEQVFHRERIGVKDDFVRLGGDSLTAIRLVTALDLYGLTVPDVLMLRTPAALAAQVEERMAVAEDDEADSPDQPVYTVESGTPLTPSQLFMFNDAVRHQQWRSYMIPIVVPVPREVGIPRILAALDAVYASHPILSTRIEMRDGEPWLVQGPRTPVMTGSFEKEKIYAMMNDGFDIRMGLAKHMIVDAEDRYYLVSMFHHLIYDIISGNHFEQAFRAALEGRVPETVDDEYIKLAAFQERIKNSEEYEQMSELAESVLEGLDDVGFVLNPGKPGKPGFLMRELDVDTGKLERFLKKAEVNPNILFTGVMACVLSRMSEKETVAFGMLDHGRENIKRPDAIGLFITGFPMVAAVGDQSVGDFLRVMSDSFYQMMKYSFFPFAPMVQQYDIKPVVMFQYLPAWILGETETSPIPFHLDINEEMSRMDDMMMVDAMADLIQTGNRYTLRIFHSGYYTREIIEALANNYQEILSRLIDTDPSSNIDAVVRPEG